MQAGRLQVSIAVMLDPAFEIPGPHLPTIKSTGCLGAWLARLLRHANNSNDDVQTT